MRNSSEVPAAKSTCRRPGHIDTPSNISWPHRQLYQKKGPSGRFPRAPPSIFRYTLHTFRGPTGSCTDGPRGRAHRPPPSFFRHTLTRFVAPLGSTPDGPSDRVHMPSPSPCRPRVAPSTAPRAPQEAPNKLHPHASSFCHLWGSSRGPLGAFLGPSGSVLGAFPGPQWGPRRAPRTFPEGPKRDPQSGTKNTRERAICCGPFGALWGLSSWGPLGGALGPWDGSKRLRDCPRPPQDSSETAVEHHG